MQNIVIEEPYEFVAPHRGNWWPSFIQFFNLYGRRLRRVDGVEEYECRGVEHIRESVRQGHGVMFTPNHCRPADALVIGFLGREGGFHVYAMASWHLFKQDWFTRYAIHKMGAFSIYREGADRKAIYTAIDILAKAERPLCIFPEASVTRTNDVLHAMLEGPAFIARAAAKRRAKLKTPGKVVVHPVAIKYLFGGDVEECLPPVLTKIEQRLSWLPQEELSLIDRIKKVGKALLCLKELEHFGTQQQGSLAERLDGLINRLLVPLEEHWLGEGKGGPVVPRVKPLRAAILPDLILDNISAEERARRWRDLADIYLAQQVSCYIPDYLTTGPSITRLLETVERFEEDLTDVATIHGKLKVIIQVDEAIEVSPRRDRSAPVDPLMIQIEERLEGMLGKLALESPLYVPAT